MFHFDLTRLATAAVYDNMCNMDSLRSKFARQSLRHGTERRFGGGKCEERRACAQRGGCSSEEYGSSAARRKATGGFAAYKKTPKGILPPQILEKLCLCCAAKLFPTL
jgi:hypothetical protein